jgi:hypothetical protein
MKRAGSLESIMESLNTLSSTMIGGRWVVRGGRFVAGTSGEQFALPEAVTGLRALRRRDPSGDLVSLSAADPLNLTGIVTPGPRVPALTGNRVLYRDGVPVAVHAGGHDGCVGFDPSIDRVERGHQRLEEPGVPVSGQTATLLTDTIEVGAEGMLREVLFPQARGEELDFKGGVGIDALEDIDEIDVGIDALEATGGQQTLNDADMARADFRPTEQPVFPA